MIKAQPPPRLAKPTRRTSPVPQPSIHTQVVYTDVFQGGLILAAIVAALVISSGVVAELPPHFTINIPLDGDDEGSYAEHTVSLAGVSSLLGRFL